MKILNEIKIDKEKLSNEKFNIKRINQNRKKIKGTTAMKEEGDTMPLIEDKKVKDDNQKIINDNKDNSSKRVSCKALNSIMKITSNEKQNKSTNIINKNIKRVLAIEKFKEIHEQKRKYNIIEIILYYQCIINLLFMDINKKSYIRELKNYLFFKLDLLFIFIFIIIKKTYLSNEALIAQRFVLQDLSLINKNIISIFVI